MKANFIIGKKQIILGSLIVILSGAVYVNYLYSNTGEDYSITDTINATDTDITESELSASVTTTGDELEQTEEEETQNYGDTQLVSNVVEDGTYFAEAELSKLKNRDEAIETVNAILESVDISDEEKEIATQTIVEISEQIEDEGVIENLIKAKGFEECIVYIDSTSASVVVKSEGLDSQQAAQIKNIVLSQKDIEAENISIVEVW